MSKTKVVYTCVLSILWGSCFAVGRKIIEMSENKSDFTVPLFSNI